MQTIAVAHATELRMLLLLLLLLLSWAHGASAFRPAAPISATARTHARTRSTAIAAAATSTLPQRFPIPMVPHSENDAAHLVDVYTRLGKERKLLVSSFIDTHLSNLLTSSLLYLNKLDAHAQIDMVMNCPGGDARAVLSVVDVMHQIEPRIRTINLGLTSGLAVLIAAAGTAGLRTATPHARFHLQYPAPADDVAARPWLERLSFCTGETLAVLEKDATSTRYMDAREAVGYGICDHVLLPSTSAQLVRRGRDQAKATFGHFAASKPLYHPDILKKKDG